MKIPTDFSKVNVVYIGSNAGEKIVAEEAGSNLDSISMQVARGEEKNTWNNQLSISNISPLVIFDLSEVFKHTVKSIK